MTKVIVVGNFKGGIGKTTTTVNLAYTLSAMGHRTLVIDNDPQSNSTPFFAKAVEDGHTVLEAVKHPERVKEYIVPSKYTGLDVLKGNTGLMGEMLSERELGWLSSVKGELENDYDFIIVDTNPDLSSMTASALVAADVLLTPVALNEACRDNLSLVESKIEELVQNGMVWKVFAMKVDLHRKSQKKALNDIVGKHLYPFMEHYISSSADVDNAWTLYKPVGKHRSRSIVAEEFQCLAEELLDILEEV